MSVYIKNISGSTKVVRGHEMANDAYHLIAEIERPAWAADSSLLADISTSDLRVAKSDDAQNDITDLAQQIAYLNHALPNGVEVANTVQIITEYDDPSLVPKFSRDLASFDVVTKECVLEVKVPGTFPNIGRYIKDGYAFTDKFMFGDYVSKLELVDKDNKFGYGAGFVLKAYHDIGVPADNQGWFLWAGESGTGECDLENSGGLGLLPAETYLRCTIVKQTESLATEGAINIFWSESE